jgi:UPF0716 protein FxsA
MPIVFLIFIIIPIIEISLLINVGQLIGAWYTIGLVLLSAFIGINMLRYQGLSTLARAQQKMRQGEMPQQEMIEGLVLAVGGALLITPGFVTDIIGFCCLFPFTRMGFIKLASRRFKSSMASGQFGQMHSMHQSSQAQTHFSQETDGDVFEGEFSQQREADKSILPNTKD